MALIFALIIEVLVIGCALMVLMDGALRPTGINHDDEIAATETFVLGTAIAGILALTYL